MIKRYCDRCEAEIPEKIKNKFFGIIDYNLKNVFYAMFWKKEYILCKKCGDRINIWIKNKGDVIGKR